MARVLLGVCGGISAYKSVELVRLATKAGHSVRVIQTPSSLKFVGRATFEGITGAPVLVDEFEPDPGRGSYPGEPLPDHEPISHLELVRRCDVFCIAPATANTIAKLAGGHADSLVSAAYLACTSPVIIAPAMNNRMYEHGATQSNLKLLTERGARIVDPGTGALASRGEWGVGRLAEPADLLGAIEAAAPRGGPLPLDGSSLLITAGGTREPLDAVRFLGNRSSGRMGFALAEEAARRGADVTVIAANTSLPRVAGIEYVDVETAQQLRDATLERLPRCDALLMAAAVADYRPAQPDPAKISKQGRQGLTVELERTDDVLTEAIEHRRRGQLLVGFAAEFGDAGLERARAKLEQKQLDAIVFNDIARTDIGFDSDDNEATIIADGIELRIPKASKAEVAQQILDFLQGLRSDQVESGRP
jgi:phosphopantothenoylcysteine decarboxylase/phosphopantothenate--cysteine ligase